VADSERLARSQHIGKDHLSVPVHGSSTQISEQGQPPDHGPDASALDDSPLPTVAHPESDGPIEDVHSRLISIQVDLVLPRLRPSTKARPTMTSTPTMMA
jgi:hypothetical protein